MFAGIIEWSMANGYTEIATATDVRFERILQRAGWPMTRLGGVELIGETMSVAGVLPADRKSFSQVCPPSYRSVLRRLQRAAA
jgi:acyl homoserine lactone synthase